MTKRKTPEEPKPRQEAGRPTSCTPELVKEICERLSKGEPLAEICRDEGMPHPSTVRRWANRDEQISLAIADAREDGEDLLAANIRRTARGEPGFSSSDVQRDKLIIESDLKLLAKWNPKKWGDRQHIDMDASVVTRTMTDEQLDTRLTDLLGKAGIAPASGGEETPD